jgi:thioesterase domain-containing protein
VLTADRKTIPTFFVGHSLGGALAMLAALDIQKRGGNVAGLVTLGQPRVGNAAFAAEAAKVLQGKIKRFVNGNDPFPHMPPTAQHSDAALAALLDPATKNATMALLAGITAFTGMSFGKANFTHVGPPSTLSDAAFSRGEFDADSPWDGRYWKENAAQVRQMAANPGAASQLPIVQEHMVESHLCEMLKKM